MSNVENSTKGEEMIIDDGGTVRFGMTLRDYFAAAVLNGLMGDESVRTKGAVSVLSLAGFSYEMADAMIEARKK